MKTRLVFLVVFLVLFSAAAFASNVTVTYSASNGELCNKHCVYKNENQYTVGLGSSSALNISKGSELSLTAEITDENDDLYIIMTKKDTEVADMEAFLKDRNFADLVNPSFGYPIIDIFTVMIGLQYSDIYIVSAALQQGLGKGLYSLVLRNNGTISSGPGAGSTEVVVDIV